MPSTSDKVNDYTVALNGFSAILTKDEAAALASQNGVPLCDARCDAVSRHRQQPGLPGPDRPGECLVDRRTTAKVSSSVSSTAASGRSIQASPTMEAYPAAPALDDSRPNCEFGNSAHNPNDAPFECNNKLIGARQMLDTYRSLIGADPEEFDSARDDDGHGTHTARPLLGMPEWKLRCTGSLAGQFPVSLPGPT